MIHVLAEQSLGGSRPTATTDDEQQAFALLKEAKLISVNIPGSAASRLAWHRLVVIAHPRASFLLADLHPTNASFHSDLTVLT